MAIGTSLPAAAYAPPAPQPMDDPRAARLDVLDVLRGIALFGMFAVHFLNYAAWSVAADPQIAGAGAQPFIDQVRSLALDGRFHAMFGILFGVGFAIQLDRAAARGEPFTAKFLRRLAALAVFGFIAEGVFGYNVLLGYAIWAVPLLLVRRWRVPALVVLLILCAASPAIYGVTRVAIAAQSGPGAVEAFRSEVRERNDAFMKVRQQHNAVLSTGSWAEVVESRIRFMPRFHWQWSRFPTSAFTLFLLGLIAYRVGVFQRVRERRNLIAALMLFGLASWAISTWVLGGPNPNQVPLGDRPVLRTAEAIARVSAFRLLRDSWLAFTYIGAVLLLFTFSATARRGLGVFAWSGRMALTNYMLQVMLLDTLFGSHLLGLALPPVAAPVAALALFAAVTLLSRFWLTRFDLGPLEWVWRCVTYWRREPLSRRPRVPSGSSPAPQIG